MDGATGCADPAFDAHVNVIKSWELAWWEGWFPAAAMARSHRAARANICSAKGSIWRLVTGPAAATIATLKRLGWATLEPAKTVDDLGFAWDFRLDSPAAIAQACKASVRRWRLARIADYIPGLLPDRCDIRAPDDDAPEKGPENTVHNSSSMIIDFASALAPLLKGKTSAKRVGQQWDNAWRGDAMSAVCGGQWPQVRKAAVPAFGIDDVRCQLCFSEPGTLMHRFRCPATQSGCALQPPSPAAALAAKLLSEDRRRIAKTRALFVLRVPAPPTRQNGVFNLHAEPDWNNAALHDSVWYCDGSLLQGRLAALRTTGFGIAVVAADGQLLGFGSGRPPARYSTATATEAYAMLMVLQLNGFTPNIRTDCHSLLNTRLLSQKARRTARTSSRTFGVTWRTYLTKTSRCW